MHDYQVSKFPILADKLKDVKIEEKSRKKIRTVLSKADRQLVKEALEAGGNRDSIAKRFNIAPQTVGNIAREARREKLDRHVEAQPKVFEAPLAPELPKEKKLTQCVTEVYEAIELLSYEDKVRVLMSVTHLFDVHISVQA